MRGFDWCSFTWDPVNFPDPKKYLKEIKDEYDVKICAWINPYISESLFVLGVHPPADDSGQRALIFKEGAQKGYFLKRTNGKVWQWYVVL